MISIKKLIYQEKRKITLLEQTIIFNMLFIFMHFKLELLNIFTIFSINKSIIRLVDKKIQLKMHQLP